MSDSKAYNTVLNRLKRRKSPSTFHEYKRHIQQFRDWLDEEHQMSIFEAQFLEIEDMIDDMLEDGYSASTVRVRRAALSEFYNQAIKLDEQRIDVSLDGNPMENITLSDWQEITEEERKKAFSSKDDVPFLTPSEIDNLANNVPSPTIRNELMIRLAFQTGCRRKELVRLQIRDIGRNDRSVTIRAENAKSGKKRKVGYQPSLDFLLDEWMDRIRPSVAMASQSEYLFPSNRSLHISGQQFNGIVKQAAERTGIQSTKMVNKVGEKRGSVTAHVLRHSFAMAAISNNWNLYVLKDALGHSSVEITEMYLHDDEKRVMKNFRERGPSTITD